MFKNQKRGNAVQNIILVFLILIILAVASIIVYDKYFKIGKGNFEELECSPTKPCDSGFNCINYKCVKTSLITPQKTQANVLIAVYDRAGTTISQLTSGAGLHVWSKEKPGDQASILEEGSTITTPNYALKTYTTNYLDLVYFTQGFSGYYGVPIKDYYVEKEQPKIDLKVYRAISKIPRVEVWINGTGGVSANAINLSIGANSQNILYKIVLQQNETDRAFNFGGIGFRLNSSSSAISDIAIGDGKTNRDQKSKDEGFSNGGFSLKSDGNLQRDRLNFLFKLDNPIIMLPFDIVETGTIVYQTGTTGCPAVGEYITGTIIDANYFIGSRDKQLKLGLETDANVPVDVGVPDITFKTACTA